jgi:hypothetical protein
MLDGYGVNYAICPDKVRFSISSKFSGKETSSVQFRQHLKQSLADLRKAFESAV